jgi:hypothetical protein
MLVRAASEGGLPAAELDLAPDTRDRRLLSFALLDGEMQTVGGADGKPTVYRATPKGRWKVSPAYDALEALRSDLELDRHRLGARAAQAQQAVDLLADYPEARTRAAEARVQVERAREELLHVIHLVHGAMVRP